MRPPLAQRNAVLRYRERKARSNDAAEQAQRLLVQHSPETARRVAAETALEFKRDTVGRLFWQEVVMKIDALGGAQ